MILLVGALAFVAAGAAGLYAYQDASPSCESTQALDKVDAVLRDDYHLDSIFLNNIRTLSGSLFSGRHECSAEVAAIRGNVNASDMPWRELHYRIEERDRAAAPTISVTLGANVPLAKPGPSLWEQLLGYL
jgi:hypothetical protein